MNLALIKKYLPEFNSYVKGQPLTLGYKTHWGTYEWTDLVWVDWDSSINEHIIIINDEYLPYKKALAEGKIVQYKGLSTQTWCTIQPELGHTFGVMHVSNYRIKPEEPELKVGDWITVNGPAGTFIECISGITDDTYVLSETNVCYKSQATKWEPKEGEICIFWDSVDTSTVISKFSHMEQEKYSTDLHTWNNCMPFTGALPPHMKD